MSADNKRKKRRIKQSGMTLIEIMVVTLIIALMSTGVAVAVINVFDDTKLDIARGDVKTLKTAVKLYSLRSSSACPSVEDLVEEEIIEPDTRREDPWETQYIIECAGSRADVFSAGPDKTSGTEDDIR